MLFLCSWVKVNDHWKIKKYKDYDIQYNNQDRDNIKAYNKLIKKGKHETEAFFNTEYKHRFAVVVHLNRHSLDSTWQKDWNMPDFKSECWMVASGVGHKLDLISPHAWKSEACEHRYEDALKTQQLITHELIHVYHGQINKSPDFSDTDGVDWFVEGLATYASGQYDSTRTAAVKKILQDNTYPKSLDDFWKGKNKYGLSGSMLRYIDLFYGREKLISLLPLNNKADILAALNTTETALIDAWAKSSGD